MGARAVVGWLEGYEQHGDPAQLACRAQLAVLEHFRRPGAFLATAIFVDDPASQSLALAEAAPDLRCEQADMDAFARALRSRDRHRPQATTWAAAALTTSGTAPRRWRAAAACALPLSPGPSLDAEAMLRCHRRETASPATLATFPDAWRCRAGADDVPIAVAARATELSLIPYPLSALSLIPRKNARGAVVYGARGRLSLIPYPVFQKLGANLGAAPGASWDKWEQ